MGALRCAGVESKRVPEESVGRFWCQLQLKIKRNQVASLSVYRTAATKASRQPVDTGTTVDLVLDHVSALLESIHDERRIVKCDIGSIASDGDHTCEAESLTVNSNRSTVSNTGHSVGYSMRERVREDNLPITLKFLMRFQKFRQERWWWATSCLRVWGD